MEFIKKLILGGQIPYFSKLRIILLLLSFSPVIFYAFSLVRFGEMGELGWQCLIAIMLVRPLADIFPDIGLLRTLTILRKELGIFAGLLIFFHAYTYFENKGENIFTSLFSGDYWHLNSAITWGILGFIVLLPLLITSNKLSMRLLRNKWKWVQKLAYPLFFFSAVHIALIRPHDKVEVIVPVIFVLILWLLAKLKVQIPLISKK